MATINHLQSYAFAKKKGDRIDVFEGPHTLADFMPVIAEGSDVPRMLKDRFADVVNVLDFGAKGDGTTDDTEAIQAACTAAGQRKAVLWFDGGKRYIFSEFSIPSGVRVQTNGCELRCSGTKTSTDTPCILVGDNCQVDCIHLTTPAQSTYLTYIYLNSGVSVNKVSLIGDEGTQIDGEGLMTAGQDVKIGSIVSKRFDRPFNVLNEGTDYTTGFELGSFFCETFRRGVRLAHINRFKVGNCYMVGMSPNATLTSGSIAVLLEGVSNGDIGDIYAEGSGETAVRIGGSNSGGKTENLNIGVIYARNIGGNAFKINPTVLVSEGKTETADNISVKGIYGIDIAGGDYHNNANLMRITHARNVNIGWAVGVTKDTAYSCQAVLTLNDVDGLWVGRISATKPQSGVVSITSDQDIDEGTFGGPVNNVFIDCLEVQEINGNAMIGIYSLLGVSNIFIHGINFKKLPTYLLSVSNSVPINGPIELVGRTYGTTSPVYNGKASSEIFFDITHNGKRSVGNPQKVSYLGALEITANAFAENQEASGLFLVSNRTDSSNGAYGAAIEFSKLNARSRGAAIAIRQRGNIQGQTGLSFFVSGSEDTASNVLAERFWINTNGDSCPGEDNTQRFGSSNYRWSEVFSGTGAINTSDSRVKSSVASASDALLNAVGAVPIHTFQFTDAVEKKGANTARFHAGVIAQEVASAFQEHGLDAARYGLFCHDEWPDEFQTIEVVDQPEVLDENGEVVSPAVTHTEQRLITAAGDRYGIRYEELLMLECARLRRELQRVNTALIAHGITLGDE